MFSSPIPTLAAIKSAEKELNRRRSMRETYVEPLSCKSQEEMNYYKTFMSNFYRTIYKRKKECDSICEQYPNSVGKYYQELVDEKKVVTYEDFWQRYFYRCGDLPQQIQKQPKSSRHSMMMNMKNKSKNDILQSVRRLLLL